MYAIAVLQARLGKKPASKHDHQPLPQDIPKIEGTGLPIRSLPAGIYVFLLCVIKAAQDYLQTFYPQILVLM